MRALLASVAKQQWISSNKAQRALSRNQAIGVDAMMRNTRMVACGLVVALSMFNTDTRFARFTGIRPEPARFESAGQHAQLPALTIRSLGATSCWTRGTPAAGVR